MAKLKGRSIGLKARMDYDEMFEVLKEKSEAWGEEGHNKEEIISAISSKVHPLANGFYWNRFPTAQEIVVKVFADFSEMYVGERREIATSKGGSSKKKNKKKKEDMESEDLVKQFAG